MKTRELSVSYISSLCLELSLLMNAGIVPYDGVLMLWEDERDKDSRIVLKSIIDRLADSVPLSTALRGSGYFPDYMVNLTEVGEKTGRLSEALHALSVHYDRKGRMAAAIKNAVLYPVILLIMMVAVVLILIIRVLPVFGEVFTRIGGQMPPLALSLMQFGGWLADASAVIAAIIAVVGVVTFAVYKLHNIRREMMKVLRNKFGGWGIFWDITAARFISAMSMAAASGLAAEEAVELAAVVSGGGEMADKKYKQCKDILHSGGTLAEAMHSSGIISARNSRVLAVGGRSGMTDAAMAEIATRCEQDTQDELERIIGRIEPALVISSSLIAGIILLTIMLPLMGIMTSIGTWR